MFQPLPHIHKIRGIMGACPQNRLMAISQQLQPIENITFHHWIVGFGEQKSLNEHCYKFCRLLLPEIQDGRRSPFWFRKLSTTLEMLELYFQILQEGSHIWQESTRMVMCHATLKSKMAIGRYFGFWECHNFWIVWARTFKFYRIEAISNRNPPEWSQIIKH